MKKISLLSVIFISIFFISCNEPDNKGFQDFNLPKNTNLNIDTNYVSGTNVLIEDLYNKSILNYDLNNIQNHSIQVNNLKYNLSATSLDNSYKCFIYNGVKYFEDNIADPLLYCDEKSNLFILDNEIFFNTYKMTFPYTDALLPISTDSFDGFYLEYGIENEMSLLGMPITIEGSINDSVNKYINYISENQIIEQVLLSSPLSFRDDDSHVTSTINIETKMKIGSMSLLNIISKEIMKNTNVSVPSTFLSSSDGRVSDFFQVQINYLIRKDSNDITIGYVMLLSVFAKDINNSNNLTPEDNINQIINESSKLEIWDNISDTRNISLAI